MRRPIRRPRDEPRRRSTRTRASGSNSLEEYEITRTFRAATGDIIVSETTASYIRKEDGKRYREFGIDVYWVNDAGKIYHKHTSEVVEPYDLHPLPPQWP